MPAPPARARLLHVACLAPGCFHEAVLSPAEVFGEGPWDGEGLSLRFRCVCGARRARLSYVTRRPKPANPCGWL